MSRKSAIFVTPGRGSYARGSLGYLAKYHDDKQEMLSGFDMTRTSRGQDTICDLDMLTSFSPSKHSRGDNASALIFASSLADFLSIDRQNFEIVAVTGNSMGWYTALSCAGALTHRQGFEVANTMGVLMQDAMIGGQIVYPIVDENWVEISGRREQMFHLVDEIDGLYVSIRLGGMLVFAGEDDALRRLESKLEPVDGRYPMRLANHAAFHTPLLAPVSKDGMKQLQSIQFSSPELPMIDGRGHIWLAKSYGGEKLRDYTLAHQVTELYDFSASIRNAMREFAPDAIIASGPGNVLGSAIAQILIEMNWRGLSSKQDFLDLQSRDPLILSMGLEAQRNYVTGLQE